MSYCGGPEPSQNGGTLGSLIKSRQTEDFRGLFTAREAGSNSNHWRPADRKVSRSRATLCTAQVCLLQNGQGTFYVRGVAGTQNLSNASVSSAAI